jgi:hypothetical protein
MVSCIAPLRIVRVSFDTYDALIVCSNNCVERTDKVTVPV